MAIETSYYVTAYDADGEWQDCFDAVSEAHALTVAKDKAPIDGGYLVVKRQVVTDLHKVSAAKKLTVKKIK